MSSYASSSSSSDSDSDGDEHFGITVATQTLPTPQLQALRICDHVLVTLDYEKENYGLWSRQFLTALSKLGLRDHVDGSPAQGTSDWALNDFAIVSWFDATVTPSTMAIVDTRHATARALWRSIRNIFRDNRDTRATFLRDEFHSFNQGDLSVVDYTSKMKHMADTLGDLGSRVKSRDLVHNVIRGLGEHLQHAVPHMTRGRLPTFVKLRSFLLLEERRLGRQARVVAHNALVAQAYQAFHAAAGAPMPAFTNPAPPAYFNTAPVGLYGINPSQAGQSAAAGNRQKMRKKNPSTPAPGPLAIGQAGGPNPGARAPNPTAPSVAGTFQAWAAPGILGPRPSTPTAPHALSVNAAPAVPVSSTPQWDQSALIAALNQMSLQAQTGHDNEWVFDSGASSHMGSGFGINSTPRPPNSPSHIIVGDGATLPITGTGSLHLSTPSRPLSLLNILISPNLIKNLVSVRAFTRDNFVSIEFDPFGFSIKDLATGRVIHRCNSTGDLYPFVHPPQCFLATASAALWHQRLGHPGAEALANASKYFKFSCNKSLPTHCNACRLGKHTRLPFSLSTTKTSNPFELCHCDLWTSPVLSISGFQYYLVILDDFTHFAWTFPIRQKSEVPHLLKAFYAYVRTQFSCSIKAFQTDNGREFDNTANRALFTSHGTILRLTCPYMSQQNGKAERILRTLNDGIRTLLIHASMPPQWWAEALATSTYLLNRRPCKSQAITTPYELLHGHAPDFRLLRVFGCLCYPNLTATGAHKLAPRSIPCVFLGYPDGRKGYRCYDPVSRRLFFPVTLPSWKRFFRSVRWISESFPQHLRSITPISCRLLHVLPAGHAVHQAPHAARLLDLLHPWAAAQLPLLARPLQLLLIAPIRSPHPSRHARRLRSTPCLLAPATTS